MNGPSSYCFFSLVSLHSATIVNVIYITIQLNNSTIQIFDYEFSLPSFICLNFFHWICGPMIDWTIYTKATAKKCNAFGSWSLSSSFIFSPSSFNTRTYAYTWARGTVKLNTMQFSMSIGFMLHDKTQIKCTGKKLLQSKSLPIKIALQSCNNF